MTTGDLKIAVANFTFDARFEERDAPQTVAAFRDMLPITDRIIHCRWSGESNWAPWGTRDLDITSENTSGNPAPRELLLCPGGESETELLFPYGLCVFASKVGAPKGNRFATVVHGSERLPELGHLTLWGGA